MTDEERAREWHDEHLLFHDDWDFRFKEGIMRFAAAYAAANRKGLEELNAKLLDQCATLGLRYYPACSLRNERAEELEERIKELEKELEPFRGEHVLMGISAFGALAGRWEKAEREVARLREVLRRFMALTDWPFVVKECLCWSDHGVANVEAICEEARAALAEPACAKPVGKS